MLEISHITVGSWQSNCYLISDPEARQAVLIDPGAEADRIIPWIASFNVAQILITHADHDHIGALEPVRSATGAAVWIHPAEAEASGLRYDHPLTEGTIVELSGSLLTAFHVPGHTPGSVVLHLAAGAEQPLAVVGDAVFPGGPGRTGSHQALLTGLEALERTVFTWPDETVLYPGHGASTTVGAERPAFEKFRSKPLPPDLFGDVTW
ncbi:MAG: MBL fold metallo-hydrolase [Anaerolineales bacterium]|nr:MBL fold metallo-hydrolase [Anaerolineales bacterium]